jgi:hypothetical protein
MNEKELRQLINEVTAEIIAESQTNSEDEWYSDEHETLGDRKFADRQANAGSDADNDGSSDADELRAIAKAMDAQKTDSREVQNSLDAISANEVEGKLSFDDWVDANGGQDAFGPDDNAYDAWLRYSNPERYDDDSDEWYEQRHMDDQDAWLEKDDKQDLIDKHFSADAEGGVFTDDEDELLSNYMQESKSFTFDKFMKDINGREDKIELHKKELTENEGDTNARLKQKLYQEDWRNSVSVKRDK